MIYWHIVSSEVFYNGTTIEGHLYFLTDTREIFRGSANGGYTPYTESVIMYTGTLPTSPAINRLYINSETLEGKVWTGAEGGWKTVINAVSDEVADVAGVAVSGKAVVAYVAAELAKMATAADTVSAVTWDSAEHILTVTKGTGDSADVETIIFDGLGADLNYDSSTGDLQLVDASGNKIGNAVRLDLERFVTAGEYDAEKQTIFLYFDQEKTNYVEIPVSDLVDTYTAEALDNSLQLSVESGNKITGKVKISTASGNLITVDENGLYVAPIDISGKMDKVEGAVKDNIAVFGDDGQVVDSGKAFADLLPNNSVYVGASIDEAVAGNTPVKGDFCIVKTQIGTTGKYQHTAYVHNGTNWEAMDGNYSAANVYLPEDLTSNFAIGKYGLSNGSVTIPVAGKNLMEAFTAIYQQLKNPSTTQPSVSITFNQKGTYEVGSNVTPSFTASLNAGKYTYGPDTGITATGWTVKDTISGNASTNSGSFDTFVVTDDMNADGTPYAITATATYGDGAIPVTNQGTAYEAGQIKAGSKSKTSDTVTGYRCGFYGTLTEKLDPDKITSDIIRGLKSKTTEAPAAGTYWELEVPVGCTQVVFAYPASIQDVTDVLDKNASSAQIKSAFTMIQVDVKGANDYTAIPYKVYYQNLANANDAANIYYITL